jgi:hypothetical protein
VVLLAVSPDGVVMVVCLVVSVVDGVAGGVTTVVVSAGFYFTTVVDVEVPAGVVETSVLQPVRPRASSAARA